MPCGEIDKEPDRTVIILCVRNSPNLPMVLVNYVFACACVGVFFFIGPSCFLLVIFLMCSMFLCLGNESMKAYGKAADLHTNARFHGKHFWGDKECKLASFCLVWCSLFRDGPS